MDLIELEKRIQEAEDRVRGLLARTSTDDSWACQTSLREAVERLRALRALRDEQEETAVPY